MEMGKVNIAVIAGGWSSERAVSLMSGNAVCNALDKDKYHVNRYDPKHELAVLIEKKEQIDLAFILLHGRFGEDGRIQGLLDIMGIPFVGSGVLSSAMAVNKKVTKDLYRAEGLSVAEHVILKRDEPFSLEEVIRAIGIHSVVKPLSEGSSVGMSVCGNEEELRLGIQQAFALDREIMIEKFIEGREVTCCVLGNRQLETLPIIEILLRERYRFFDYEAKYTAGETEEICPAQLSEKIADQVKNAAIKAHQALGCEIWSRTDMIIHHETVTLLETNTIPGMTENSLFPLAARTAGISFPQLLDRLIRLSFEKKVNVNVINLRDSECLPEFSAGPF